MMLPHLSQNIAHKDNQRLLGGPRGGRNGCTYIITKKKGLGTTGESGDVEEKRGRELGRGFGHLSYL